VGQLGSVLRVVGRLGSIGVWVNASFQVFALTAGDKILGGKGNCPAGKCLGEYVRGGKCLTLETRCSALYPDKS